MFDEQPDGDPHGECAAEIHRLQEENEKFRAVFRDLFSVRDQFAAKAMHQLLAGAVMPKGYDATEPLSIIGRRAYEIADAMLKARNA